MKNTKGLSGVITTLIIILLVIAAIGIIWAVVNPFIKGSTEDFNLANKCRDTNVEIVSASCLAGANDCSVTLQRNSGDEEIAGVKLIFYDEAGTSNYIDAGYVGDIDSLARKTVTGINVVAIGNLEAIPATVSLAVYFEDASGTERLCGETGSHIVNVAA